MNMLKHEGFDSLPNIADLYKATKERDLTIPEREYLKGARYAWKEANTQSNDYVLYPKQLTEAIKTALSYMCFDLIKAAQVYRDLGYEIPKKAEEEQAFFLHRFILLAIEHGNDFIKVFNEQTHALVESKAAK